LRKQLELAAKQRLVVRQQHAGSRGELPAHQRSAGVGEQPVGVRRVERMQIGRRPEIGKEQEAGVELLGENLGRVHAGGGEQRRDPHERAAVLARRRRVHCDQRSRLSAQRVGDKKRHAKVAPEARVFRSGCEHELAGAEHCREPIGERGLARVVGCDGGH
jgi:hypothetical protein